MTRHLSYRKEIRGNRAKPQGFPRFLYGVSSVLLMSGFALLAYSFASPLRSLASFKEYVQPVSSSYFQDQLRLTDRRVFEELGAFADSDADAPPPFAQFSLSIPSLDIQEASVRVHSETISPDDALGHVSGSALPGGTGQVVIFGHSSAQGAFMPSDYRSLFSHLDTLTLGDMIELSAPGGSTYFYRVTRTEVVSPEDLSLLMKQTLSRKLVLITCYPIGTTNKRLLVHADIISQ